MIYKYQLGLYGITELLLPEGAQILSVQNQRGHLVLWADVNRQASDITRKFMAVVTGSNPPERKNQFIGTVQFDNGNYVVHVFEVLK